MLSCFFFPIWFCLCVSEDCVCSCYRVMSCLYEQYFLVFFVSFCFNFLTVFFFIFFLLIFLFYLHLFVFCFLFFIFSCILSFYSFIYFFSVFPLSFFSISVIYYCTFFTVFSHHLYFLTTKNFLQSLVFTFPAFPYFHHPIYFFYIFYPSPSLTRAMALTRTHTHIHTHVSYIISLYLSQYRYPHVHQSSPLFVVHAATPLPLFDGLRFMVSVVSVCLHFLGWFRCSGFAGLFHCGLCLWDSLRFLFHVVFQSFFLCVELRELLG